MKNYLLIFFTCLGFLTSQAQYATINIQGQYEGKNIFIVNPIRESGIGLCVDSIWVNGKVTDFEISSAFEIRLKDLELKVGDSVHVEIKHYDNCKPRIINQAVSHKKFEISNVRITKTKELKWTCPEQDRMVCFRIEEYRWNKWIKVVDSCTNGQDHSIDLSNYSFHSGENQFRISSITPYGRKDMSGAVEFNEAKEEVTFLWIKNDSKVYFSRETKWELFNSDGAIVKMGVSKEIDGAKLKSGTYFLNYDNVNGSFKVKKKK